MILVAIAWLYVVLMMAVAEAVSTQGTVLGAVFTFLLYGLLPLGVVLYIMGTPGRSRARKRAERAERAEAATPTEVGEPTGTAEPAESVETAETAGVARHAVAPPERGQ